MTSYASLKKARDARKSKRRAPNSTLPAVAPTNQSRKKKLGGPRRKQLPARNSARRKSEFARCYGSKERVAWVKRQPCMACVMVHPSFALTGGTSHNAHTATGGKGRKADYTTIVPLCATHHRWYDGRLGWLARGDARYVMKLAAVEIERRWQEQFNRRAS